MHPCASECTVDLNVEAAGAVRRNTGARQARRTGGAQQAGSDKRRDGASWCDSDILIIDESGSVQVVSEPGKPQGLASETNNPAGGLAGSGRKAGEGIRTLDIHVGNVTLYH